MPLYQLLALKEMSDAEEAATIEFATALAERERQRKWFADQVHAHNYHNYLPGQFEEHRKQMMEQMHKNVSTLYNAPALIAARAAEAAALKDLIATAVSEAIAALGITHATFAQAESSRRMGGQSSLELLVPQVLPLAEAEDLYSDSSERLNDLESLFTPQPPSTTHPVQSIHQDAVAFAAQYRIQQEQQQIQREVFEIDVIGKMAELRGIS